MSVSFGNRKIGPGQPVFIAAEIGINHNGSLDDAKKLIEAAAAAGADAVKFQKRTPEICVPDDQKQIMRDTPWGRMSYLDYRYKVEFDRGQYLELGEHAKKYNLEIFASPWDIESVDFLTSIDHNAIKIASASLTDLELLKKVKETGKLIIASTGMSTMSEITSAMEALGTDNLVLCHATSAYPCSVNELNLKMIHTLQSKFGVPVGYSGHEVGLATTLAAVAMGAVFIERHITLDRTLWGSDQAASVEPVGFAKLVRDIRSIELAMGDGVKKVYASEEGPRQKLRRV
jgi:N-acetylneuraminate synthase